MGPGLGKLAEKFCRHPHAQGPFVWKHGRHRWPYRWRYRYRHRTRMCDLETSALHAEARFISQHRHLPPSALTHQSEGFDSSLENGEAEDDPEAETAHQIYSLDFAKFLASKTLDIIIAKKSPHGDLFGHLLTVRFKIMKTWPNRSPPHIYPSLIDVQADPCRTHEILYT